MTTVTRVRMPSLLALSVAGALLLAGCGSGDSDDRSAPAPGRTTPPVAAPETSPSPPPSPSGEPSATAKPPRRPGHHKTGLLAPRPRTGTRDEHLLAPERMPGLGDAVVWTIGSTEPEDPAAGTAVGACQKTAIGAIGAVSSVRRTFRAPDGIAATQVVARFADPKSAWRAHQVLIAWRDDCAERLSYPHAEVGPLVPVRVHAGTGESYLAAYGQRARARQRATGFGILRAGSFLTLVEISTGSGDYPADRDPAGVAVRRISRTF